MPNSQAIFSRRHTWGAEDVLLADDLNKEFDNILTNFTPSQMGGYSYNVSQMQIQTAPGGIGSESLATTLAGELERLRYQINVIQGTTYWYQTPASSIAQLNAALGASSIANRVSSGTSTTTGQPAFLIPDGTTNQVTLSTSTPFIYSIAGTQYTISSDITLGALSTAGATSASTTCIVNDTTITSGQTWTQLIGENGSTITVATMGTSISAQIGKVVAFKNVTSGEIFLSRIAGSTSIMDCYRGYFQTSSTAFGTRENVTNGDTLFLMTLSWVYATTAGSIQAISSNPYYQGTAPATPANGDRWFDQSTSIWKSFDGITWNDSHSTLIGITVQDNTKTVGTRAQDFFAIYSATNTVEIFDSSLDTVFPIRSRYLGSTISVNGSVLNFGKTYPYWTAIAPQLIDGTTISAGEDYYFYISSTGNFFVSAYAPYDRQADLLGFYHKSAPYRCVGYAICTTGGGSPAFGVVESFFRNDHSSSVSSFAATLANFPRPYVIQPTEKFIELDATSGAFTQILAPPIMWKGNTFTYIKTDNSTNAITLKSWGLQVLVTTCNITQGNTSITSLASNTGLSAGITYYISGSAIPATATATWASGSTATSSVNSLLSLTGSDITFATGSSINGKFTRSLTTPYEAVELFSDGSQALIVSRSSPPGWRYGGKLTINSVNANATKSATVNIDRVLFRRNGSDMIIRYEFWQTTGGTQGTGDYLISIPTGYEIDTSFISLTPSSISALGSGQHYSSAGTFQINSANVILAAMAIPYNSTQFRIQGVLGTDPASNETFTGLGSINLGASLSLTGEVALPILGWSS